MQYRVPRAVCLLLGLSLVLQTNGGQAGEPETRAASKPNILLFIGDDLTWHDAGCYGNEEVRTPNIDRLASEGMRLTRCFTATAMCSPTRQQLYTGVFPVRSGAYPNHSRVYEGTKSMAHHLGALGYRVALLGKRHYGPPESYPFEFLGGRHHDGGQGVDLDIAQVRKFIEGTTDRPWCLVVASNQPHEPWNRGDASAYDPETLRLPPYLVDTPRTRRLLARYYAEVTYLDEQLGQVLEILTETGTAEESIVLFTSEQGSSFPFCKWTCYETGLRTMLIVRWPGRVRPGSRTDAMVQYTDIVPTLIEAVGGDPSEIDTGVPGGPGGGRGFDGRSFLPVLTGKAKEHRDYTFGVQTTRGIFKGPPAYPIRSVRDERYKLILNLQPETTFTNLVTEGQGVWPSWERAAETDEKADKLVRRYQHRPAVELYDLKQDPYELHNLADDPAHETTIKRLRKRLDAWMNQQGDEGLETEMNAKQRQS